MAFKIKGLKSRSINQLEYSCQEALNYVSLWSPVAEHIIGTKSYDEFIQNLRINVLRTAHKYKLKMHDPLKDGSEGKKELDLIIEEYQERLLRILNHKK